MEIKDIKAALKNGSWDKMEGRLQTLKALGIDVRIDHIDKRVARVSAPDESGFPRTFHIYNMVQMRIIHEENPDRLYGKQNRRAFR